MFIFTSRAHKRSVAKIIRATIDTITASQIRYRLKVISKTMDIPNFIYIYIYIILYRALPYCAF